MSGKFENIEITGRMSTISRSRIIEAASAINSVCDGARELDGHGFNGVDAPFFKYWLNVESNEGIKKDLVIVEMYQRLQKYKKQLEGFGINYNYLKPEFEQKQVDSTWKAEITFGKYKGKTFEQLVNEDLGYIQWMSTAPNFFDKQAQWAAQCVMANKPITKLEVKTNGNGNGNKQQNENAVKISIKDDKVIVAFKYDENLVNLIKGRINFRDREFNREQKVWEIKIHKINDVLAIFPNAILSAEVQDIVKTGRELSKRSNAMTATKTFDLGEFGHGKSLLPFQEAGVEFLEFAGGRAILADEMGTGKTIQTLAFAQLHKDVRPFVIVCPASLKLNWKYEAITWLDTKDEIQVINSGKKVPITGDIIIINYDILGKHEEEIMKVKPQMIAFDEAHVLKTYGLKKVKKTVIDEVTGHKKEIYEYQETGSNRAKTAVRMSRQINMVILLTGTPVLNRPKELYPLLHMVDPKMYPLEAFPDFGFRYCDAKQIVIGYNKTAWDFNGASNIEELNAKLKQRMIRRTKDQVLPELPPKRRSSLLLELDNMKGYTEQAKAFGYWLLENRDKSVEDVDVLPRIEYLKQMTVEGKIEAAIDWLDNSFIKNDQKVVVFCTHKEAVNRLMDKFGKVAVKIDGSTKSEYRQAAVDKFQNDKNTLMFIGNIKAAGVGLTLTAASDVVFLEFDWTPAIHDQAEDRCHRIGQKDSVNAYYLISEGTIDEFIVNMLERKRKIADGVVGDEKELNFNLYDEIRDYFIGLVGAEQASAA
jgi:SWI/SNF-related matrix-associated actin-dependent regulator of chromatin subfamily A-like protein 1